MLLRWVFVSLCACVLSFNAWAEEKITSYDVIVDVQKNGDFIVTETIAVIVEGSEIRRGIFRDIPRYLMDGEYKIPQKFDVLAVTRDGKREKYETSNEQNALRIKIGNDDRLLPLGAHIYELKYRAKNQIRYFDDFDEVYWNATGTFWKFKIDKAKAEVILPDRVSIIEQNGFTGTRGSTRRDYDYEANGTSHIFTSKAPLPRYGGLTVSLKFGKGLIDPPSASERRFLWWVKNGALIVLSFSLFGILGYYFRSWDKVGRDPIKDPVFPRYKAPDGYSPAAVSHIHFKGFSGQKALISSLVAMGIHDVIKIDSGKKKTVFSLTNNPSTHLPEEQDLLFKRLFPGRNNVLTLDGSTHTRFNGAHDKFLKNVGTRFSKNYYRRNVGYIILGVFLTVGALIATGMSTFGVWKPFYWFILGALIATNIVFFILLPAPTKKGQKLMSEIKGFKLYLEKAEKLQMNAVKVGGDAPPPMTRERYERFLPYAIALGVEKPWSKYFQAVLPEQAKEYSPHWSAGNFNSGNISRGLGSVVSNISSGVSSAAPQPSSSSGGGGGGFSGGGGGGGGGGGW